MIVGVSRAMMALAICCMGMGRRDWALAMRAEFEFAVAEGRALGFAAGCLIAAWREMPHCREGRLVLAHYGVALGLLVPVAALQFGHFAGFLLVFPGAGLDAPLAGAAAQNPFLIWSQLSAVPILLLLWFGLAVGHLRLAWALVEQDWPGVVQAGAMIGAAMVTLLMLMEVLLLDVSFLISHVAALGIELAALFALASRQAKLAADAVPEMGLR